MQHPHHSESRAGLRHCTSHIMGKPGGVCMSCQESSAPEICCVFPRHDRTWNAATACPRKEPPRRRTFSQAREFKWEEFQEALGRFFRNTCKKCEIHQHPSKSYSTCSMEGIARNIVNHSSTQTHTHTCGFCFASGISEDNWPNPAKIHLKSIINSTRTSCSRGSSSGRLIFWTPRI